MKVTTLDDISAVIGYTRTRMLQSWYGGKWLRLPQRPTADHGLAHLLGEPAMRALWQAFVRDAGLERLWVPTDVEGARYDRRVKAARMFVDGCSVRDVARRFECSQSMAEHLRKMLMRDGWIEYDMDGPRKYRLTGNRGRRKILGTSEVFQEPPGSSDPAEAAAGVELFGDDQNPSPLARK
jgi:hypothetical protein